MSGHETGDVAQINAWISEVYNLTTVADITLLAASIGSPIYVWASPDPLRVELYNSERPDKDIAYISKVVYFEMQFGPNHFDDLVLFRIHSRSTLIRYRTTLACQKL